MFFVFSLAALVAYCLSQASMHNEVYDNMIFTKTHSDLYMYQGIWKLTIYTDLAPFGEFLKNTLQTTKQLRANYSMKFNIGNLTGQTYLKTLSEISDQMLADLIKTQNNLISDFEQIPYVTQTGSSVPRDKRSLLPIGGKLLSLVFGTVTEGEVKQIRTAVNHMITNQKQMHSVLKDSLSVVEATRHAVSDNRHKLNELLKEYGILRDLVVKFTNQLVREFAETKNLIDVEIMVRAAIDQIMHVTSLGEFHMQQLALHVNMLVTQKLSPAVIAPQKLSELIKEVSRSLPGKLKAVTDLDDIWHVYTTLACRTTFSGFKIYTIIDIPLFDPFEKFGLYSVIPLKVFHNIKNLSLPAYAAHEPDMEYILLENKEQDFYMLSQADLSTCPMGTTQLCKINKPRFYTDNPGSCVLNAYFRRNSGRRCKTVVKFPTVWPVVTVVDENVWMITLDSSLAIKITCGEKLVRSILYPPVDFVTLPEGCLAHSSYFELRHTNHKPIGDNMVQIQPKIPELKTNINLWTSFTTQLGPFLNSQVAMLPPPKEITALKEVDMTDLKKLYLDYFEEIKPIHKKSWFWPMLGTSLVTVLGVIACVVVYKRWGFSGIFKWLLTLCSCEKVQEPAPVATNEPMIAMTQLATSEDGPASNTEGRTGVYPILVQ